MVHGGLLEGELGLTDFRYDGVNELHDLHIGLVGNADGFVDDILGSLLGFRFDHDHLLEGGGDAHEAVAGLPLVGGGVNDILTVQVRHIGGSHRAVPGHVGAGDGDGSAQRGHDLYGVIIVVGKDGAGHDGVVAQLLVKQGTHGPVDNPAVQDAPLRGLALPAVEGAGDPAHGVHPLLKLDGQGEVVNTGLGDGVAGDGGEDHGVAVTADALGVGQLRYLTGFHGKGTAADFHFVDMMVGVLLAGNHLDKNLLL